MPISWNVITSPLSVSVWDCASLVLASISSNKTNIFQSQYRSSNLRQKLFSLNLVVWDKGFSVSVSSCETKASQSRSGNWKTGLADLCLVDIRCHPQRSIVELSLIFSLVCVTLAGQRWNQGACLVDTKADSWDEHAFSLFKMNPVSCLPS